MVDIIDEYGETLVDRAVHAAFSRFIPSNAALSEHEGPALLMEDFSQSMHDFLPVAMRDITNAASDGGSSGWDDVGGLVDIQNAIKEVIYLLQFNFYSFCFVFFFLYLSTML